MYETFLENKICIRCKKKIKPNELKLFRSNTEFHKKILDEEYNRTEYPKAEYSLYCFHIQCISHRLLFKVTFYTSFITQKVASKFQSGPSEE